MAIPESIKKKANQVRNEVYGKDVREALASGIEEAGDIADQASTKSDDAVKQVDNIQAQVDQLVVEGDSSVEAAQARVDAEGKSYPTLKARLDAKETQFSSQLAQIAINVGNYGLTIEEGLKNSLEIDEAADVLIPGGVYLINEPINVTLKSKKRLLTSGEVIFKFVGEANEHMLQIIQNGNDLEVFNITFDCNSLARVGFIARNNSESMENAVDIYLNNVKVINGYSRTNGEPSNGIFVSGGYNSVVIDYAYVNNMSRAKGVGVPYLQGTKGIAVTHNGINAYPRKTVINYPIIKHITSEEDYGSSDDLDCDGVAVFAPLEAADATFEINNPTFEDCKGRSIKSQVALTHVNDATFIRKGIKTIHGGLEVDFQNGSGTIKNSKHRYYLMSDGESPLGDSFAMYRSNANGNSFVLIDGVDYISNIPTSKSFHYFLNFQARENSKFTYIKVDDVNIIGDSVAVASIVRGNFTNVDKYSVSNVYVNRIMHGVVDNTTTSNSHNTRGNISDVYQADPRPVPLERNAGGNPTTKSGYNNIGFIEDLTNADGEALRVEKIMAKHGDRSGAFAIESEPINIGQTHTYSKRGFQSNNGVYFLTIGQATRNSVDCFIVGGVNIVSLSNPSNIAYGQGSNPNEPGKFNVWFDDEGCHVFNNTGNNRFVTLASIG